MENIIFARNYSLDNPVDEQTNIKDAEQLNHHEADIQSSEILGQEESSDLAFKRALKEHLSTMPEFIIQKDKENYEYLLKKCDAMAKTWKGKIYGIVDYQQFQSKIQLTLNFIEFSQDEERTLLKDIAEKGRTILFSADEEGKVTLSIYIDYFR